MSASPIVLAQISDAHLRVGVGDGASARALESAVRSLAALDPAPQALLISGDLVDTGTAAEYRRAQELLAPLSMPIYPVAGNHDDRDLLRSCIGGPAAEGAGDLIQYAVRVDRIRLVICDTVLPGQNEGVFGQDRLGLLEAALATDSETPTVVAMHHPPLLIGIPVIDELGMRPADQSAIAGLVSRSPQVRLIVSGHVHRTIFGAAGGCGVFVCPSSHVQLDLAAALAGRLALCGEPPGFALHLSVGGDLSSHALPIGDHGQVS